MQEADGASDLEAPIADPSVPAILNTRKKSG